MKPKQLIWIDGRAETPFGVYQVDPYSQRYVLYFQGVARFAEFYTRRDAQAAAQADFERRYRECQDAEIRAAVLDMLKIAASPAAEAPFEERQRAVNTILEAMGEL